MAKSIFLVDPSFVFEIKSLYLSFNPLFNLDKAVAFSPTTELLAAAATVIIVDIAGESSVLNLKSFIKPDCLLSGLYPYR